LDFLEGLDRPVQISGDGRELHAVRFLCGHAVTSGPLGCGFD
jgi:hypothetical protein